MAGERVLTLRELNRALLARQLLLSGGASRVQQAVERLCAIQAQYSPSPYIALWTRVAGFKKEQLTRALEQKRSCARRCSGSRCTSRVPATTPTSPRPGCGGAGIDAARGQGEGGRSVARRVPRSRQGAGHTRTSSKPRRGRDGRLPLARAARWHRSPPAPERHVAPLRPCRNCWSMKAVLGVDLPPREEGAQRLVTRYLAAFGPATQERPAALRRRAGRRYPSRPRAPAAAHVPRRARPRPARSPARAAPGRRRTAPVRFLPKWDSSMLAYAAPERARILPESTAAP